MKETILTESVFNTRVKEIYKEEQYKFLNEKWKTLSKEDKTFVLEFYKATYPEKSKLINESKWYNTLGDIVGIFDPTGIVDLVNGVSYWRQGDKLFAILSFISVLPYLGDAIAKPVVGALKLGGDSVKAFKYATIGGDAIKIAETAKVAGGPVAKLVETSPTWGTKLVEVLRSAVGKVPFLRKIVGLVEEYIKLFTTAGKEMKVGAEIGKGLGVAEKESLKSTFKGFREYGGGDKYLRYITKGDASIWKKFVGGAPRLFGNAATRSLMRRTKWYLGLLDWMGIANTRTSPDDLVNKYSDLDSRVNQYNTTEAAQQNWSKDFGSNVPDGAMDVETSPAKSLITKKIDPIDMLLGGLFK